MAWLRICGALTIVMLAGCASVEALRSAQGSGEKRTYGVSYERAWNLIPYAISDTGGKVKDRNFQSGVVIAEYGLSLTSLGERVALFCQRKGANEVEIEVVSKQGFSLGLSSTDYTAKIFTSLDRQLRP
jgi:uncharacterized lipoprotein